MATTNKGLNTPAYDAPNWDVPLNENFNWIDASLGTTVAISVAGVPVTPVVLTATQYRSVSLSFSGLLGNNVNYRIPSGVGGSWAIFNSTTGAFTLTISSGGLGTSVVIPQGQSRSVISDGTNIKIAGNVGAANQVIYNDGSGPVGDSDFTFISDVLSSPRLRTGDGTPALPAISPTTSPDTGMYFPAVDEVAFSTNGTRRLSLNSSGAMGLGISSDYGTVGKAIKSSGGGSPIGWDFTGAVAIASLAASGNSVTFSGLTLTSFKFLVLVLEGVRHAASGGRSIQFSVDDRLLTVEFAAGNTMNGMCIIHLGSGAAMVSTAFPSGTSSSTRSTGLATGYTNATTSITVGLNGSGGMNGGTFYLLGIA